MNEDPEIYEDVINNIKKTYHILDKNEDNNFTLKTYDHLITKGNPYKIGKILKYRKSKLKLLKLPLTVIKNFNCGVIKVVVDEDIYGFKKGENYYVSPKDVKLINEIECKLILDEIKKDLEEYNKRMSLLKERKKKKKRVK